MGSMPGVMPVAIAALSTPEDHLRRVELSQRVMRRFDALVRFSDAFALLFSSSSSGGGAGAARPQDLQRVEEHFLPIALCAAAHRGDVHTLEDLVKAGGANVNAADYDGRTALHIACAEGHVHAVK